MKKIFLLVLAVVFVGGCATAPVAFDPKPGMIPDFKTTKAITIKNGATDKALIKWTNSLVNFLTKELTLKGASITADSSIVLTVNVTHVGQDPFHAYWANKCYVTAEASTGNGYNKKVDVGDVSVAMQRAASFAITKAGSEILSDPKIIEYLQGK